MSVIPITIFFSLLLAGTFVVLFAREQRRRRYASPEHDSLLPLADERPRTAAPAGSHHHEQARAAGSCGCRDGQRPPCAGCRSQAPAAAAEDPYPETVYF